MGDENTEIQNKESLGGLIKDDQSAMSYFQDATVTHEGRAFHLSAEEARALESGSSCWYGLGDPSTWLAIGVFYAARQKAASAPESVALELAAQALGITVECLVSLIRWHENYMRFHDGDYDYRVLSE